MNRVIKIWSKGIIKYDNAYNLQKILAGRHLESDCKYPQDTLLLVEHPPVYTIGIRTAQYTKEEENKLKKLGADFHRTNRGGLITFHGPGQLVAYPIINLKTFNIGVRDYICKIEKTVVDTCKEMGINNVRVSNEPNETGVWINNAKICAIGVHASRYITSHGLALNCNTDLSWYSHIVPCGLIGKDITSLSKELNQDINTNTVIPILIQSFCKHFNCIAENYPEEEKEKVLKLL
jgi:lipoyl(octanoyl) transferase